MAFDWNINSRVKTSYEKKNKTKTPGLTDPWKLIEVFDNGQDQDHSPITNHRDESSYLFSAIHSVDMD